MAFQQRSRRGPGSYGPGAARATAVTDALVTGLLHPDLHRGLVVFDLDQLLARLQAAQDLGQPHGTALVAIAIARTAAPVDRIVAERAHERERQVDRGLLPAPSPAPHPPP